MKKDYCTAFPESWVAWRRPSKWYKLWEYMHIVYIDQCCKEHDGTCSTIKFIKCLYRKRALGFELITLGGMIGCAIKYNKI